MTVEHAGLRIDAVGAVRLITIDRPAHKNAIDESLHRSLATVWNDIAGDAGARAVVVTGAGRCFSAGGDMSWFSMVAADADLRARVLEEARQIVLAMVRFPLPVIAAVNGPAVGLGCSLALLGDVVLMADDAWLADPHVSIGLVAGDGGAAIFPAFTSLSRAKELLFTGDRISATDAVRWGLASRSMPGDTVLTESLHLATRMADQPAFALRATKRALNMHLEREISGVLDFALAAESESFLTDEHAERMGQLLDRAAPPAGRS